MLAQAVFKRRVSTREQRFFASVMPPLREHPEGVTVSWLCSRAGLPNWDYEFYAFIRRMFLADLVWYGSPGTKAPVGVHGIIRLSPKGWLTDTLIQQLKPEMYAAAAAT